MNNVINQMPYLRTSREFPEEMHMLTVECNKAYVDTANVVNERTIGIHTTTRPAINGEQWYLVKNLKQQAFRQVYTFTGTSDINIGFKLASISQISKMSGVYTDGTSWFGLIPGTSVAIAGQILFYVTVNALSTTSDVIKFVVGGGAPSLTSGKIVLEWLSQP